MCWPSSRSSRRCSSLKSSAPSIRPASTARPSGIDTVKTALVDHYGRTATSTSFSARTGRLGSFHWDLTNYDGVILMPERLLDKPYFAAIAQTATIEICTVGQNAARSKVMRWMAYQQTDSAIHPRGQAYECPAQDAKDLNNRIDGTSLGIPARYSSRHQGTGRIRRAGQRHTTCNLYDEPVISGRVRRRPAFPVPELRRVPESAPPDAERVQGRPAWPQ